MRLAKNESRLVGMKFEALVVMSLKLQKAKRIEVF